MKHLNGPSASRLRSLFRYEPASGIFYYLLNGWRGRHKSGDVAGHNHDGYVVIYVDGIRYRAHHLAWLYMTGEWPDQLDHRDLNRSNNRWENIRIATQAQNMMNRPLQLNNTSGLKGVYWCKKEKKWRARIKTTEKHVNLGYFDCRAAGHLAYIVAADIHHGEFSRIK